MVVPTRAITMVQAAPEPMVHSWPSASHGVSRVGTKRAPRGDGEGAAVGSPTTAVGRSSTRAVGKYPSVAARGRSERTRLVNDSASTHVARVKPPDGEVISLVDDPSGMGGSSGVGMSRHAAAEQSMSASSAGAQSPRVPTTENMTRGRRREAPGGRIPAQRPEAERQVRDLGVRGRGGSRGLGPVTPKPSVKAGQPEAEMLLARRTGGGKGRAGAQRVDPPNRAEGGGRGPPSGYGKEGVAKVTGAPGHGSTTTP